MYELVILSGTRTGAIVPLSPGVMLSGRSPDCHVEIPDPSVSRHHANLILEGTQVRVVDLRSANGTWVNEQQVQEFEERDLHDGDILRFGDTRLKVQRRRGVAGNSSLEASGFSFDDSVADFDRSLSLSMADALKSGMVDQLDAGTLAKRIEVINWVSEALSSYERLEDLYEPIMDTLFEVFQQAERGFLLIGDDAHDISPDDVDHLEVSAMRTRGRGEQGPATFSRTLCREVLARKSAYCYQEGDEGVDGAMSLVSMEIRSAMMVPLMVQDSVLGLMIIDTADTSRAFSKEDLALAATVGRQIAIALKNARLVRQAEEEAATRRNLTRFLPKPVADQFLAGKLELSLGGSTCDGTVFFSDIVGFTRISEGMDPHDIVAAMNAYFDRMVPCIENSGGAIDKFMGDAIMAFWGIPFSQADAACNAVRSALLMQNGLVGFGHAQQQAGLPALQTAIGINSGSVVAGNIGSDDRLEYTILGDCVNTAQRLESRGCCGHVIIAESTWEQLDGRGIGIEMPRMAAKNKAEPVGCYSIRGLQQDDGELLLHVPIKAGSTPMCLIRRIPNGEFVALVPEGADINGATLVSDMPEVPDQAFGIMSLQERLPLEAADDGLQRCVCRIDDADLERLLNDGPVRCGVVWDQMPRI